MKIDRAINIEDLRRLTQRRLPRIIFDFIEGGVEDEHCLKQNKESFQRYRLMPRYLIDVSTRTQSVALFGRTYDSPFGIAPTGLLGLCRHDGDLILAEAAAAANVPFVMSSGSNASLEAAARVAPAHVWYQLYAAQDPKVSADQIRRANDAGLASLVVTIDAPVRSKRERNMRNGWSLMVKLKVSTVLEALTHPGWVFEYLRHGGIPGFENWTAYASAGASVPDIIQYYISQCPAPTQTWRDLETYRGLWPRTLIVKGILHPDDAVRATEAGADGIIVSNHGGRQIDRVPAPLEVFPAINAVVGHKSILMLDSGVRRGSDIVVALCLGARFVFVGRAAIYGLAAGGLPGVRRAIDILREETDLTLGQIGCPSVDLLGPHFLLRDDLLERLRQCAND